MGITRISFFFAKFPSQKVSLAFSSSQSVQITEQKLVSTTVPDLLLVRTAAAYSFYCCRCVAVGRCCFLLRRGGGTGTAVLRFEFMTG